MPVLQNAEYDLNFRTRLGRPLQRRTVHTVQVNVGKRCNQACHHCHVDAGPKRTEQMDLATAERVMALVDSSTDVRALDITGGAPELNPSFRWLVSEGHRRGLTLMDRCNLTVLLEPGQEDTASFLAEHDVHVIASLPCYSRDNVDKQRGRGVFGRSIEALQRLNAVGYGRGTHKLTLVYNPGGPFLPPSQQALHSDYSARLGADFGIVFDELITITNMPIARFRRDLERSGALDDYEQKLREAYNPETVEGLMCRDLVSISWDGRLFDCDFNQMLELRVPGKQRTVWDLASFDDLVDRPIALADHCYGCTAGAGSSCGGALT